MGWFSSSEERTEEKAIDSTGQVNNNIIIQEAKDTHSQMLANEKLLVATYILVFFEIIKLGVYIYINFKKGLKKKYNTAQQNKSNSKA